MQIAVYADESGTHDETGKLTGAKEATICGIVALCDDWIPFRREWQKTLINYKAPYFHFREWSSASAVARNKRQPSSDFVKNPYRNWDVKKLNDFVIELATIAGSGNKLTVGGCVYTSKFHEALTKGEIPAGSNPYELCAKNFFEEFIDVIEHVRAPWKRQPVSFFFDWLDDEKQRNAVYSAFRPYKERYPKFSEPVFQHKTDPLYLPLQAADMVAYRSRQITEKYQAQDTSVRWPELDNALFKGTYDLIKRDKDFIVNSYLAGLLNS
jgi:hypothetical protein